MAFRRYACTPPTPLHAERIKNALARSAGRQKANVCTDETKGRKEAGGSDVCPRTYVYQIIIKSPERNCIPACGESKNEEK